MSAPETPPVGVTPQDILGHLDVHDYDPTELDHKFFNAHELQSHEHHHLHQQQLHPREEDLPALAVERDQELPSSLPSTPTTPTTPMGFAAMPAQRQRQIAAQGGHAAQAQGRAHQLTDEERSRGGKSGGHTTAQNRNHMADIGSKGGQAAQRSGHAHKLTDEERSRGGQRSRSGRKRKQHEMLGGAVDAALEQTPVQQPSYHVPGI